MRSESRGSVAVLVLFALLPLLLFGLCLSVDLPAYFLTRARLQSALDEAGLNALRFLPERAAVIAAARRALSSSGIDADVEWRGDALDLRHESDFVPFFAGSIGDGVAVGLSAFSRVGTLPVDVMIVLEASERSAPAGGSFWGNLLDWPAAELARPMTGGDELAARRLTQLCFNPHLSASKRAAILSAREMRALPSVRVMLSAFPGEGRPLDVLGGAVAPSAQLAGNSLCSRLASDRIASQLRPDGACGSHCTEERQLWLHPAGPSSAALPEALTAAASTLVALTESGEASARKLLVLLASGPPGDAGMMRDLSGRLDRIARAAQVHLDLLYVVLDRPGDSLDAEALRRAAAEIGALGRGGSASLTLLDGRSGGLLEQRLPLAALYPRIVR